MPTLNRTSHVVIFDDLIGNNNPQRRHSDWRRALQGIPVGNPQAQTYQIPALGAIDVFDGSRTLVADGTTEYALSLSGLGSSRYRLTHSAGQAPGFRAARTVAFSGGTAVLALQVNSTVVMTSSAGNIFGNVVVGDTLFIPGASTGDTALFNSLNDGYWTVLAAAAGSVTLARASGTVFSGASETVVVADDASVQFFGSSGVQVGDTLDITAGFSEATQSSYRVVAVTATRLDFTSTAPLATESAIPGAAGLSIYSAAKRYTAVETDQRVALRYNGNTDDSCRLDPVLAGDSSQVGISEKWGATYSLTIKNRSTSLATVTVISAE